MLELLMNMMDVREGVFCTKYSRVDIYPLYVVKTYLRPDEDEELIENEVALLRQLCDSGIVPTILEFGSSSIKLQRCQPGSLRELISSNSKLLSTEFKTRVISDCESILLYLHKINIVHGDFTSFNILVECVGSCIKIKVCDFMTSGEGFINNCASRWRKDNTNEVNKPEHDWFALGVVIWELIMMEGPYFWLSDQDLKVLKTNGVRLYCKPHTLKDRYIYYASNY